MNRCSPREGSLATAMAGLRDALKSRGDGGSNLGMAKLISLEVEVSFSTQCMNEKSDRG